MLVNCTFLLQVFCGSREGSTGRAIALPPASASALALASTKILKFYVKVFKNLYFLNPDMNFVYIWYDNRWLSKILLGTVHTPAHDLEVKVTDLEILCYFASKFLRSLKFKILAQIYIWHDYRYWSKNLSPPLLMT